MSKIAILPGDGIGPEIMAEAVKVLDVVKKKFSYTNCIYVKVLINCTITSMLSALPLYNLIARVVRQSSNAILRYFFKKLINALRVEV